jgi:hypothetical protein
MKNTRKGAWRSKRGPTPAIPAYKPPRQTKTSRKAETMSAPEIVVVESEAKSDSEEDTCFRLVYEKMTEINSITDTDETEPETEVKDSDGEEDNIAFGQLMNKQKESVGVETEVGMKVAKQFEAGLFVGEVTAVTGKRGRCLYTILYEDGDGKDMNDKDFKQARALFLKKDDKMSDIDDTNTDTLHSGGGTEGSEFAPSDDDEDNAGKKKNARGCVPLEKRRKKLSGGQL